jgi:predicted nucleic acid-binding protein
MTSTPSAPPRECIVDTTALRHFTMIGQAALLVQILGGTIHVPREVFDSEEELTSPEALLSEIGRTIRYVSGPRYIDPDRAAHLTRLTALRTDRAIGIMDLSDEELALAARLSGRTMQRRLGLAGRLGAGEAAVMAIAMTRGWDAAIDDGAARDVLHQLSPGTQIATSQVLLRQAVARGLVDSAEAQIIYNDLLSGGFRGPNDLWAE